MRSAFYVLLTLLLILWGEVTVTGLAEERLIIPPIARIDGAHNTCLPIAVIAEVHVMRALQHEHVWARIIRVTFYDDYRGHAIMVFALPKTGAVFQYDTLHGSKPLFTTAHDLDSLRKGLHIYLPRIRSVQFID